MSSEYLKPSSKGFREPTDNARKNSNIYNPPRFPEMGGLAGKNKAITKNEFSVRKPK